MSGRKSSGPIIRRGSFPYPLALVSWIDLLGYGEMIAESGFNPLHEKAAQAMTRLITFHEIVAKHSDRRFPTLVMNDGAIAYRDLSFRHASATYDFLRRSWNLFCDIKKADQAASFPGPRLVLACGFRMHKRRNGIDRTSGHLESVMTRLKEKKISPEEAVIEAASSRRLFDIVPELQANFAFTKAYVAESSGSRGGLGGANFFVDLSIFDNPLPPWITLGETIPWSNERLKLSASFAPVMDLPPWRHASGGPEGIKDALQVARSVTNDPNILKVIRASRLR